MSRTWALLAAAPLAVFAATEQRFDLNGEIAVEARGFFDNALDARQKKGDFSLRLQPEHYAEWGRDTSLTFTPFLRLDSADDERTHADLREFYVRHRAGAFEIRAGMRKVFWGATESSHLVDILNQTDLVENPDTEDKLGQPMVDLAWITDWGTLHGFVLPYFRERSFPGVEGRLRITHLPTTPPTPIAGVNTDVQPLYESDRAEKHVDWALRYSLSAGNLDLGVSHFSGTARAPRFNPLAPGGTTLVAPPNTQLVPFYDLIEQSGLDATYVAGGWLLKLEAIHQYNRLDPYTATSGGFEYTVTGLLGSADVGLLAEYLWDERGRTAPTPFNNDVFVGTRIAFNDEASSEILAGAITDADTQAMLVNIEASRRFGSDWKCVLESRLFANPDSRDASFGFRNDDYVSLELIRYFGVKNP